MLFIVQLCLSTSNKVYDDDDDDDEVNYSGFSPIDDRN